LSSLRSKLTHYCATTLMAYARLPYCGAETKAEQLYKRSIAIQTLGPEIQRFLAELYRVKGRYALQLCVLLS